MKRLTMYLYNIPKETIWFRLTRRHNKDFLLERIKFTNSEMTLNSYEVMILDLGS